MVTFLLGLGVSFMTWSRTKLADVFIVGGAVLLLTKFLTWEETKTQPKFIRRRWAITGVGSTTIVVILAILGNHYLNGTGAVESSGNTKMGPEGESAVVFLNCENLIKPVAWDNNTLYVIETFPNLTEGFVLLSSTTGKPRSWPDEQNFQSRTYECKLRNYGSASIFSKSESQLIRTTFILPAGSSPQHCGRFVRDNGARRL